MNPKSLHLPPCPACSNLLAADNPMWSYARHTSRARGKDYYGPLGCEHLRALLADSAMFFSEPEEFERFEARWAARREELFAAKTEGWTEQKKIEFRRRLDEKIELRASASPDR
jgi:hypothetical protein